MDALARKRVSDGALSTNAHLLRFDFNVPAQYRDEIVVTLPLVVLFRLAASYAFSISTGRWRYVGIYDVLRLTASTATGSAALFALTWGNDAFAPVPRSVLVTDFVLFTVFIAATWVLYRTAFEQIRLMEGDRSKQTRVLIVCAGDGGTMLAREILRSGHQRRVVGFVDDDPAKWNTTVHGLRVFGKPDMVPQLVARLNVQEIVVAIPSAAPAQLRRLVELCQATDVAFKVLPGMSEVLEGKVHWSQVRPLQIEDLLGREPVALELPDLLGDLCGRSVLVTGAAGSIGSELVRQIALHRPGCLVVFDQWETGLFDLCNDLRDAYPELNVECVVGDIVDDTAIEQVFTRFCPSRVFHAAAYKHVTMMQYNTRQALRNNATGTLCVASAAGRHGAEKFVFVSTDKAVSPTSVMGATKRLAEMLLMEVQAKYPGTAYAAVRFGNVLGSSGSVIPIFRKQIEQGRPLTITDPDVTRYFMTIPEAVQLILQASLLPEVRGAIAMLEMGEPVRIVDLARNLLRIAGLPYQEGKSVVFTGLRAGEKMHEQLVGPQERTTPTSNGKVRIVHPESGNGVRVTQLLLEWEMAFRAGRDAVVICALTRMFPGLAAGLQPTLHIEPPQLDLRVQSS